MPEYRERARRDGETEEGVYTKPSPPRTPIQLAGGYKGTLDELVGKEFKTKIRKDNPTRYFMSWLGRYLSIMGQAGESNGRIYRAAVATRFAGVATK